MTDEPTVTLASGAVVLQAVVDCFTALRGDGRIVFMGDDGAVTVRPARGVPPDTFWILASQWRDVAAILANDAQLERAAQLELRASTL